MRQPLLRRLASREAAEHRYRVFSTSTGEVLCRFRALPWEAEAAFLRIRAERFPTLAMLRVDELDAGDWRPSSAMMASLFGRGILRPGLH